MNSKINEGIGKTEKSHKINQDSAQPPFFKDLKTENSNEKDMKNSSDKVVIETGGPKGLEPTRYGDWEQKGRCTDF